MTINACKTALILLLTGVLLSCGATPPPAHENNTELIVTYQGKEVHRRGSRYTGQHQLRDALNLNKENVIIFSADWCSSCKLTRKAINQAKLSTEVLFLNIDEPWVAKLAQMMGIDGVPFMIHVGEDDKTKAIKVGPGQIVVYLVTNF